MGESALSGKNILAVDDEPDVLSVIEEEIIQACEDCKIDSAMTYEKAADMLRNNRYDLVILDIMGVRGFDLLQVAVDRGFKVAMLTAKAMTAEALKKSHDLGAYVFLPKDKLGEIVPFLEDVLTYDKKAGWKRLLTKLDKYFDEQFEEGWRKKYPIY